MAEEFWEKQEYHSAVKAAVVSKYFGAWSKIISSSCSGCLAYIDLFAGCGVYRDGSKSTPLLVLEQIVANPELRDRMVTVFNDIDTNALDCLRRTMDGLPGIHKLRHKPIILNETVGPSLIDQLHKLDSNMPTLLFVDPYGYKGLSVDLIVSYVAKWGSDCMFFFNYNRINAGLYNPLVEDHMKAIFGSDTRLQNLRSEIKSVLPHQRERHIIDALRQTLQESSRMKLYTVPMRFEDEQQNRCSHHLVFTTKSRKGYHIAKDIMLSESNGMHAGVASFILDPKEARISALFPPDALAEVLLSDELLDMFAGHTVTVKQIIEDHDQGDNLYVSRNYKDVLRALESRGMIVADPPAEKRRKGTFADRVLVTFPKGNNGTSN